MSRLIKELATHTGLTEVGVRRIAANAALRYKIYQIPKKDGGSREIAQPAREVKALQRAIVDIYIKALPVHYAATAYQPGSSIFTNATRHITNSAIAKFDFRNFFPSITSNDWIKYCIKNDVFESIDDTLISSQILFRKIPKHRTLRLSIDAPSSPIISNVLLYEFDHIISEFAKMENITYTRYADDITCSAPRMGYLVNVERTIRRTLRDIPSPRLHLNPEKTIRITSKYRRSITGLIITNQNKISIGRDKKRKLYSQIHYAINDKLSKSEILKLSGYLSYINAVEPAFLTRIDSKYGEGTVFRIRLMASEHNF